MEQVLVATPASTSDGQGGKRESIGAVRSVYAALDLYSGASTMRVRQEERIPIGSLMLVPLDDFEERL